MVRNDGLVTQRTVNTTDRGATVRLSGGTTRSADERNTMKSKASAVWNGSLTDGTGSVSLGSGVVDSMSLSWRARTEEQGSNTNPEELIAAAHASCYSMALSAGLARAGHPPTQLDTSAVVTFGPKEGGGFAIEAVALTVRGDVPGIDADGFQEAAAAAKDGCPVSQALAGNVAITVDAQLV
jgi:osmotically inducible protein OsmC